jgi:type I restriction enzyme S subunit
MMIAEKFDDLFNFAKKSKIKAGDGLKEGIYPFYTSSATLSKRIDVFQEDRISLIFGTGGQASVHYVDEQFSTSTDCILLFIWKHSYS